MRRFDLNEYVQEILGDRPLKDFKFWAFGEDYDDSQTALAFMEAWNLRHEEKLKLEPDGNIYDDLSKMVGLYIKRKENA